MLACKHVNLVCHGMGHQEISTVLCFHMGLCHVDNPSGNSPPLEPESCSALLVNLPPAAVTTCEIAPSGMCACVIELHSQIQTMTQGTLPIGWLSVHCCVIVSDSRATGSCAVPITVYVSDSGAVP